MKRALFTATHGPFGPHIALWCLVPTRGGRDRSPGLPRFGCGLPARMPPGGNRLMIHSSLCASARTAFTPFLRGVDAAAFRGHWCICTSKHGFLGRPGLEPAGSLLQRPMMGRFPAPRLLFCGLLLVRPVVRASGFVPSTGPAVRPIQAESVLALVFIHRSIFFPVLLLFQSRPPGCPASLNQSQVAQSHICVFPSCILPADYRRTSYRKALFSYIQAPISRHISCSHAVVGFYAAYQLHVQVF